MAGDGLLVDTNTLRHNSTHLDAATAFFDVFFGTYVDSIQILALNRLFFQLLVDINDLRRGFSADGQLKTRGG